MKRYFFISFLKVFLIAVLIIVVQTGSLLLQYSSSLMDWKTDIYQNFVSTVQGWIESGTKSFIGPRDINFYLSNIEDQRVSGILLTDSANKIIVSAGRTAKGFPVNLNAQKKITTSVTETCFEIDGVNLSETSSQKNVTLMIPANVNANDIVGAVTISSQGQSITAYLLSFTPRTYVYSGDIIDSCLRSLLISIPLCVVFAVAYSLIVSRKNTKRINNIRKALNELTNGNFSVSLEHYKQDVEFDQIPQAIEKLGNSLESNKKSQKAWLASISHDLNTPISAIEMITEGFRDNVIPKTNENIDKLNSEVLNLKNRVDRVIEYATLQSYNVKKEKVNCELLIENLKDRYGNLLCEASVKLVKADKKLLNDALNELLDNAYKFGSNVKLLITEKDGFISFMVTNKGKLPCSIDNSSLLEPWTRGENGRNSSGNGLGLAIATSIATLHGGSISIKQNKQLVAAELKLKSN